MCFLQELFWQVHILNTKQHLRICLDMCIYASYSSQQEGTPHTLLSKLAKYFNEMLLDFNVFIMY